MAIFNANPETSVWAPWMERLQRAVRGMDVTIEAAIRFNPNGPDPYLGVVLCRTLDFTDECPTGGKFIVWGFNIARVCVYSGDYFHYGTASHNDADEMEVRAEALARFAERAKLATKAPEGV